MNNKKIKKPTKRGIEKYPPDGIYEEDICTCKNNCPDNCKGECGCEACHWAYQDFLSLE